MDSTQARVQELVTDYFRQRPDVEVIPLAGGVYRVAFNSDLARTEFGGQDRLTLVFDSERAYQRLDSVLITPNHPFLDIIRNDLARDASADPRLAEAYLPAQVLSPDGQIVVPGVVFTPPPPGPTYAIHYEPSLVMTYRVTYETDERFETRMRLCYDAVSGAPQFELVGRLPWQFLSEGRPSEVDAAPSYDLDALLQTARREIEVRVEPGVEALGRQLRATLDIQTRPLVEYYQKEMANTRDGVSRIQLQDELSKELRDLEQKFTCTVRVWLLSVLRLWWPCVEYVLTFPGARADFTLPPLRYDSRQRTTIFQRCEVCGNTTYFDLCIVAGHVLCGSDACRHALTTCATCGDTYCGAHGGPCSDCAAPVCTHDRAQCAYGSHPPDTYLCRTCRVESFEGQPLCLACRETCDTCGRAFPHELMGTCRLGGERVCLSHALTPDGYVCQECGAVACRTHSIQTAEESWACADHVARADCCGELFGLSRLAVCGTCQTHVCPRHRTRCAICNAVVCLNDVQYAADGRALCPAHARIATCCQRVFPPDELQPCRDDPNEALCPEHRVACRGCGQMVCRTHGTPRYKHPDEWLCHACRYSCALCAPDRAYLDADLLRCDTCSQEICQDHQRVCVVGHEVVCRTDVIYSGDLEPLCPRHAHSCIQCGPTAPFHRSDRLRTCVICSGDVCSSHSRTCPICQATTVCNAHQPDLAACASCGRTMCGSGACGAATHTCQRCGMVYCRHCLGSDGICTTCAGLQDTQFTEDWAAFFKRVPAQVDAETARVVGIMNDATEQIRLRSARNKTYTVVVALYTPKWYEVWRPHQQLLLVAQRDGQIHHVKSERPGV